MKTLRPYQQTGNDNIAAAYASGLMRLIFQLPTGGGKTITASALIHRFCQAMPDKKVLFIVHRDELLTQFRKAYAGQYGVFPEAIVSGVSYRNPNSQVYVTMVETANNRLKKSPNWFGDVGLVVIDEAHIGNFKKIHQYFPDTLIVGLTATPISSSKKHPLKEQYQEIICSTDIPDLIQIGALVPNKTFHIKGQVSAAELKVKNGEFDAFEMSREYSKSKHIMNCVKGYEDHAKGEKTIVFNCSVEHSQMVTQAFIDAGYNARHLDGEMPEAERAEILKWFAATPDAILCNIGILTAGFDEPSIKCVIMNRATLSLPLWLQCTGRGSRPFENKDFFIILDLGGNALRHGDWSTPRDWHFIFHNPPKPGKLKADGAVPVKLCEQCDAIISLQARVCTFCGAEQSQKAPQYDKASVEFELISSSINITGIVEQVQQRGANPYGAIHAVKQIIVQQAKDSQTGMNDTIAYNLLELYQEKVKEWCHMNGKNYDQWHKDITSSWFFDELRKQFQYEKPVLNIQFQL